VSRPVRVIIPFKLEGAKSRLSPALAPEERMALALAMLHDVLKTTSNTSKTTILARPGLQKYLASGQEIVESDEELNEALNNLIEDFAKCGWPEDILIIMADLGLLRNEDISGILQVEGDVIFSPGRGGGTNMILIRSPVFRTCYRGLSFTKHLEFAEKLGLKAGIFESYRAGCDIDEPSDLAEILIHGTGQTKALLESLGFRLSEKGRAGVMRVKKS
jgi:2-phospho-L-lactate guanylyltransferase